MAIDTVTSFHPVFSSSQSNLPHRYGNSHAIWDHTVLPATRQRWHSRLYPSRSWYWIKRPRNRRTDGWTDTRSLHRRLPHTMLAGPITWELDGCRKDSIQLMKLSSDATTDEYERTYQTRHSTWRRVAYIHWRDRTFVPLDICPSLLKSPWQTSVDACSQQMNWTEVNCSLWTAANQLRDADARVTNT